MRFSLGVLLDTMLAGTPNILNAILVDFPLSRGIAGIAILS